MPKPLNFDDIESEDELTPALLESLEAWSQSGDRESFALYLEELAATLKTRAQKIFDELDEL